MSLLKIFRGVTVLLCLAGVAFLAMIITTGDTAIESAYELGESTSGVDQMTFVAYITLILIVAFVVIFIIKNLFTNKGSLKSTLFGAGAFLAVLIIAYLLTNGDPTQYKDNGVVVSDGTSHIVGAGLVAFYILGAVAIGSMIWTGVKKIIK